MDCKMSNRVHKVYFFSEHRTYCKIPKRLVVNELYGQGLVCKYLLAP